MAILSHQLIHPNSKPQKWIFFVHGFLGSGTNWRSFARNFVELRPEYGGVLIDLRLHGTSKDFLPPHTLRSAAQDLVELAHEFKEPIETIVGHSLGAKVVLSFVEIFHAHLKNAWLIDFIPWSLADKHNKTNYNSSISYIILSILEPLANSVFDTRKTFINYLEEKNIDTSTAQWLSMNLEITNEQKYKLRLNIPALKELLDNYLSSDLTYILNQKIKTHISFVLGQKSLFLSTQDRKDIMSFAERYNNITTYIIPNAGHYIHIDCPKYLLELLSKNI